MRWCPFFGQAVKLGSALKDGPDDGQAEAVFGLSVVRRCELVSISRPGFYHQPAGETPLDLALMRLMDAQFLETP